MNSKSYIANLTQFNMRAEAQAIEDYTNMIKETMDCEDLDELEKEQIVEQIKELIADELNHQEVLQEIYVYITNIEPNKN